MSLAAWPSALQTSQTLVLTPYHRLSSHRKWISESYPVPSFVAFVAVQINAPLADKSLPHVNGEVI